MYVLKCSGTQSTTLFQAQLQFRIEYVGLYFDFLRIVHELAYQLARWVEHWYPH